MSWKFEQYNLKKKKKKVWQELKNNDKNIARYSRYIITRQCILIVFLQEFIVHDDYRSLSFSKNVFTK